MVPQVVRHRRARRTDFDAVSALVSACGAPRLEADRASLRRFRRVVADLGGDLYVAVADERIVGVVQVTYTRHLLHGSEGWLALLAVDPGMRRRGVGRSLAELAAARARRRGCPRLACPAGGATPDAAAFLSACGWRDGRSQFEFDLSGPPQ